MSSWYLNLEENGGCASIFRDLNKARPKDCYPLPRIDQLVQSTSGCEVLSMMDAPQRYQIMLAPEDRATYQRLVEKIIHPQIGRDVEVYVDDMLVKINPRAIGSVFVREEKGKQILNGAEGRYTPIEKVAFALVVTARRLRPNFLSHSVGVKTNLQLKQTLGKTRYFRTYGEMGRGIKRASNNEAEYEALLMAMKMAHIAGLADGHENGEQVEGMYEAKEENMIQYLLQIAELKMSFESFQLTQIPREENTKADCLSKLASSLDDCRTSHITIQYLLEPRATLAFQAISSPEDCRTSVVKWLDEGSLLDDRWKTARLKTRASSFLLQGGVLYKKSYTHPLLRCLSQQEGLHVLKEIHSGCCGAHGRSWIIANKAKGQDIFG
ncbi:UNVERIFIED_CONTAM: hypothetical protein Scaly_2670800 [Sesamum calycinum]|uniref:RNase H type-1 domain-containing protein n=1 Tax=Sesamum calycinum TaxID=2727403 RepID=A0AAW2J8I7_9LAMI